MPLIGRRVVTDLQRFEARTKLELGLSMFVLASDGPGRIRLAFFVVPKGKQGQGVGTEVMRRLTAYADDKGLQVVLTPNRKDWRTGTTSRKRLIEFYERFGFVQNKGANRDFTTREMMLRRPR